MSGAGAKRASGAAERRRRTSAAKAREETERVRTALQERDQATSMLNQRIVDLRKAIETANAEIAAARADAERLRPAAQERDEAHSALATANQKAADLQKLIETADAEITKVRAEAARLGGAVTSLQGERDQARNDLSNANAKADALQKKFDGIERERNASRGRADVPHDPALSIAPGSGQSFRDSVENSLCLMCPEMVVIPSGQYIMGAPDGEPSSESNERPRRSIQISAPLVVGKYEITFDEWDACVTDGGCKHFPRDFGWGRGRQPVVDVSWLDATEYVAWLSGKTSKKYRLLTQAEWEYAARAKSITPFWWGSAISAAEANYNSSLTYADGKQAPWRQRPLQVDSFSPNTWGLYNVHGNVREWVENCYFGSLANENSDGSARPISDCRSRVRKGGSWYDHPALLRSAARGIASPDDRRNYVGFRIARNL